MKFSGRLIEFSLPDLLRILIQSHKVGYISIFSKGDESRIYVNQGQLHHAESDGLTGESAVFNLLTYDPASEFEFVQAESLPGKTIQGDLDTILSNGISYLEQWRKMTRKYPKITINTEVGLKNEGACPQEPLKVSIVQELKRSPDKTLILHELADGLATDIFAVIEHLVELERLDCVRLIGEERLELRRFFMDLANTLYAEFESISGLKLKQEIEKRLQEIVAAKGWNLVLQSGRILEDKTCKDTIEEQGTLYQEYLEQLIGLIEPIYGKTLIQQVMQKVGERFAGSSQKWLKQLQELLN